MLGERNLKATLATELGVGPYQVSRWLTGQDRPRAAERAKVEDALGLSWRLWEIESFGPDAVKEAIEEAARVEPNGLERLRVKAKREQGAA
jgi:transcriptional regulator with XRE-family HTH domain